MQSVREEIKNVSSLNKRDSTHLCVARLDVVEEENHRYEQESTDKVESIPPSAGYLDVLYQNISERLSELCMRERKRRG